MFCVLQNVIVKTTDVGNNIISSVTVPYPDHLDTPRVLDAFCRTNRKSEFACRIALATQNGAIVQLQAGKRRSLSSLRSKRSTQNTFCIFVFFQGN